MKPANRNNLCNQPYQYFEEQNLLKLYGLFNQQLSLKITKTNNDFDLSYSLDEMWDIIKRYNPSLYSEIFNYVKQLNEIKGNLKTKMYFVVGRQYYSNLDKLTNDEKGKLITVGQSIIAKKLCNPTVRPHYYLPRMIKNDGSLQLANGHNMGNLRTVMNHFENENTITLKWQVTYEDFVNAKLINYHQSHEKLQLYLGEIRKSLSQNNEQKKTEKNFSFESIIRDKIKIDFVGKRLVGFEMPNLNALERYQHTKFETDILGENQTQRWIIEISTGHKNQSDILKKYIKRKEYFNNTYGEKQTTGWFIVGNYGKISNHKENIIITTIEEFKKILHDNNIVDTLSCLGF